MSNRVSCGAVLRDVLLAGTAVMAITVLAFPAKANAAEAIAAAEDADEGGLETITVTAEKRETNLQRTPIAISVLNNDALVQRRVQSLQDLADGAVPSLRVAPFFSRASALTIGIRGIVPFDANQPSRDAGVGVYIDGVYLGRSQGLGMALYDIERIEVLKGPQGTLFGRNSTGGAVSIVTRKPKGELAMRHVVGLSNYSGARVESHIDLPRFGDFSIKLDGVYSRRDGTTRNTLVGESDFNQYDKRGAHIGVLWQPSEAVDVQLDGDISYDATTPVYVQLIEGNPAAPARAPLVKVQEDRATTVDIGVPQAPSIGKTHGLSVHINWRIGEDMTLRSISSYRKLSQTQLDNGIGAHAAPFRANAQFARYSQASLRQKQWSQEVQLIGSMPSLDYVLGVFYYHEAGDDDAWTPNTLLWNATGTVATRLPDLRTGAAWDFPDRASTAKADSFAAFGQATWTPPLLDDKLRITLGARVTKDKKSGVLTKVNGTNTNFTFAIDSSRVDPAVTIAFDPIETVHLYGKWGTAYRAGGANSRSINYRSFGPEKVSTFEAGFKADFLDNRARINAAVYTTRYTDIQIDFSATNLNNSNRGTLETVNAPGHGTIKGLEIDSSFAPVDGLTITGAYAYTDSSLPLAANPFRNNAVGPVYTVYTPRHAFSGAINYMMPFDFGTLRFNLNGSAATGYRGSSSEATFTDKSFVVNGRITLGDIDITRGAKMEVALWARNLLNEQHTFYESRGGFATLGAFGMFNDPRIWGVDASFSF